MLSDEQLTALAAPFPHEAIHWRAQTLTNDGSKALALAYIDARDVMDHFDRIVSPLNWKDGYQETPKGRVICIIQLRNGEEWIGKSDGAGDTAVEGDKGGISDAFKRAAVKWGVGRYLYDLGNVWAPCEFYEKNGKKHWKAWKPEAQRIFADALRRISGEPAVQPVAAAPSPTITEEQRQELANLFELTGVATGPILKRASETAGRAIANLGELPAAEFGPLKAFLVSKPAKQKAA